jgi:acyl-CoA dehydrogenase
VADDGKRIVTETAARILADLADPQTINKSTDGAWKDPLWHALSDAGLPLAWIPERLGGSGASLAEGFAILGVAGRFALAVPLAETLCAGWLLARAGIEAPATPMTLAPARPYDRISVDADGRLSGRAIGVPFARDSQHIAMLADRGRAHLIALVETRDCRLSESRNLAGDAANVVTFERVKPLRIAPAPNGFDLTSLLLMASTVRSVETAGALEAILSLSVAYANERVAFERPIGKFQAVQQNLARLAGEVAAALAVAGSTKPYSWRPRPPKSAPPKPQPRVRRSRIRFSAPSALPRSTCFTASRCACCHGATTSAARVIGRPSSASA